MDITRKEVDLVLLNTATPLIRHAANLRKVKIYSRDPLFEMRISAPKSYMTCCKLEDIRASSRSFSIDCKKNFSHFHIVCRQEFDILCGNVFLCETRGWCA